MKCHIYIYIIPLPRYTHRGEELSIYIYFIWCHIVGKTAGMNIEVAEKMEEMKDKIMALEKQNHQLKEKVKLYNLTICVWLLYSS